MVDKTASFTRWVCYSHAKDMYRGTTGNYTKDINSARIYIRRPATRRAKQFNEVPVKVTCTVDLESLTYTKLSGQEYE